MRKVLASNVLLCMACLNAQCQKAEVHKNDGTTVEIPIEDSCVAERNTSISPEPQREGSYRQDGYYPRDARRDEAYQ